MIECKTCVFHTDIYLTMVKATCILSLIYNYYGWIAWFDVNAGGGVGSTMKGVFVSVSFSTL